MKDKYKIIIAIFSILLLCAMFVTSLVQVYNSNKRTTKYIELQNKYYQLKIDLKEYETAYEFLEEYTSEYMSAQEEAMETLTRLNGKLTEINTYTPEYIEQIFDDFDDCNELIINYYESGFHESNPDVSLENYIKMRDLELYLRLQEY